MKTPVAHLLVFAALLGACSSDGSSAVDMSPPAGERYRALASQPLTVDASGLTPILYATPLFDGTQLWVTYNRPDDADALDVYLTAFAADGSVSVAPTQLDQSTDNELHPSIAQSGAELMIVWAADTGKQPTNLHTRVRIVGENGAPIGDVVPVVPTRAGVPNANNNIWEASVAGDTNGFVLFGTWGITEAPAFQAYATRLGLDGALVGDAIDLGIDAVVTQDAPSGVVVGGEIRAAWENEQNASNDTDVRATTIAPGAAQAATATVLASGATAPSLSAFGGTTWGAWSSATGVDVAPLDITGSPTHIDGVIAPAVAADSTGAAVAYYVGDALRVTQLDAAATRVRDIDVAANVSTSYPIALTRVADRLFCVTWTDGKSPKLSSHLMLVDFSAP